ncbi:unnamed protein product [Symbiodinium sp. CCMP2592]|nr:unnamed protein product [Symbiodinium sp. CCMP2592]
MVHCPSVLLSVTQQELSVQLSALSFSFAPMALTLLTRGLRRWGNAQKDVAPIMEKRSTFSSSFGSSGELAASPRDWHFTLRVHVPQLELELLLAEVPVMKGRLQQWTVALEGACSSGLSISSSLDSAFLWVAGSSRPVLKFLGASHLSIALPLGESAFKEELAVRCLVAPLWACIDCAAFSLALDFLTELEEAFASNSLACESTVDLSDHQLPAQMYSPPLSNAVCCLLPECCYRLQQWDVHLALTSLSIFIPATADRDPEGILIGCAAKWSLRQLRSRCLVSNFFAVQALQSTSLSPPKGIDGAILHPCRLKLELNLALEPSQVLRGVTGRLVVDPVCISLKTEHVPLLLQIWEYLSNLDDALAAFGSDQCFERSSSTSSLNCRAKTDCSDHAESTRLWRASFKDLRKAVKVLEELIPECFLQFCEHMLSLVCACRLQLEVEFCALHVGLVQSSTDAELVIVLVEDTLVSLDRTLAGFATQLGGAPSPLSGTSASSAPTSPVTRCPRRREHLMVQVGAVSVDITSTELARAATLLEPVCIVLDLYEGHRHQPSSCKVSWVNLNISSALVETMVSLYNDAVDRTASMRPFEDTSPGATPMSPRCFSPSAQPPTPVNARPVLQRQVSISSRQPQLAVWNLLGQDIALTVMDTGGSNVSEHIASETKGIVQMPWCGIRTSSADDPRGWAVQLRIAELADMDVSLHLSAAAAIKSVAVKKRYPTSSSSITGSLKRLTSKLRCNSSETNTSTQSNLDFAMKATPSTMLSGQCWMLVRTEVGSKLHELEVHISSVLFLENRTSVSISVAPYGTPLENFLELAPKSRPQPVPVAWLTIGADGKLPPTLWAGVTQELKTPPLGSSGSSLSMTAVMSGVSGSTDSIAWTWMRSQRKKGMLQPLIGSRTWQAICRYKSMVANDYFLRSRMIRLQDRLGDECACFSATVSGVSADLQASLQALIFSVALDPAAQICNRMPCPLELSTVDGPVVIHPGADIDILKPSQQLQLSLQAPISTGLSDEPVRLHLATGLWADRLPREKHQKQLIFEGDEKEKKDRDDKEPPRLVATLETEPGLTMSESWAPLQVRQYSPRSLRLVFFTQYWLMNRRSDCRVCLPRVDLPARAETGLARFGSKRPGRATRHALMQYDRNSLRMVSEDLVRRGKIRLGLCDQRYNANGESLVPVTQAFRIRQPTVGSATAPRTDRNPVQRCFGYTVRPAPLPFHRTLIVEVVRRYTLLNHKDHPLFCSEQSVSLAPLEIAAGSSAAFDPQGAKLQIAISGVGPMYGTGAAGNAAAMSERPSDRVSTMPNRLKHEVTDLESGRRAQKRAVTWADQYQADNLEPDLVLEAREEEQWGCSSASFGLAETSRSRFQLMHQLDLSCFVPAMACASAHLARPEPLVGPAEPPTAYGRAWCLTAVDTVVEQSSVVVRFSEPLRPQFRIINRTGHPLGLCQDSEGAPSLELAPERRMSFCWFQPEGPQRLKLRLGPKEHSYEVGTVEEHSPPLHVERPPQGAAAGWFREEFLVQTRVVRGSREVHIHPHCRLTNMKGQPLLVRSGNAKAGEMAVVPHEGSVCLQRESKTSEQVFLQIASCAQDCTLGTSATHWSAPIMLTKSLSGHRGFLRHMTSGGAGMTSVFEITMVDVKKDPVSDFLVVELRPYVQSKCPYFIENASRFCCSISQLDGPEAGATLDLFPQESAPFVPVGAVLGGAGSFQVRLSALGDGDEADQSTVIDIELPQETILGPLHVQVLKERPRHIIIRDVGAVQKSGLRRSRKSQLQAFPPFLLMRRLLGSGKAWIPDWKEHKDKLAVPKPIPLSPRRRTRLNSNQFGSPASSRKRTLHLGTSRQSSPGGARRRPTHFTGASTPRLLPLPTAHSLGSPISRLRKGTLDIFWTRSGRKHSYRSNGVVFQLCAEGAGITLVDSTALHEVAYFCVETLVISSTRDGAQHELDIKLGCVQVDVRDNGASWRSNVMLRPQRARLHNPVRAVKEKPFLVCSATWTALDRGAGAAAHLEVESLRIDVQPIELRLDTMSCFQLAHYGLDLLRRAEPIIASHPLFGHLRLMLKTHWRSDGEQLLVAEEGEARDPVLGEPPCPEGDDFNVPTPVFLKELFVRRIQFFVSVRFNGKGATDCQGNEALHAVDILLRKLIPFDVSQARISLGPFFRRRGSAPSSPSSTSPLWRRLLRYVPCIGDADGDAHLSDEFLPHGFHELVSEAASASGTAVLRQIPQLLGAQRVLGSPAQLCAELNQALRLALFGVCSCSPWLLIAALLTVLAAVLESVEGIFMIVAKTTCRITAGTVPTGLRKEPSGVAGALMDLLWYGFPWHAQQLYRECRRQCHIAFSAHSITVSLRCLLEGTWHFVFSILSSSMVIVAKLFQSMQLLFHTLAWYVCPERVAELGAPLSRRVGPLLFHIGSPLQYSHSVTSIMGVVNNAVRGTRLRDWRLRHLPGRDGSLLAVQGSGFFLVRSSAIRRCVPAREADVFLAWQARGNWERVELRLVRPTLRTESARHEMRRRFVLCLYRRTAPYCKVLRLRSRRAALCAFSFAQECISSWVRAQVQTQMAPDTPRLRLLRRVHRSAAVRASNA